MNDKRIELMKNCDSKKVVLKMGLPVTFGMMFMVLYNIVDTYFIGMLNNDYMIAAVNYAYPLLVIMIALSGIVGNGASSYMSRLIGANDKENAEHTLTIGLEMILIISFVVTVLGLLFLEPLVTLLGAKENAFDYTKDYVLVLLIGTIFTTSNYAVGQLLRSEGSIKVSMVGMIVGTLLNIVLDPIFIFKLNMCVKGVAIATIISNAISTLIYFYYYVANKSLLKPRLKFLKMDKNIVKEIMYVGIPHTLEQVFLSCSIVVCNNLSSLYGELYVAAIGIANKIMTFGQYIYQGMAAGCQALFGYNYGSKNYKRLKNIIKWAIIETLILEIIVMIVFYFNSKFLIGQFSEDELVLDIGSKTLRAFILYLPTATIISIVRNVFNSIGKPMYAFLITIIRQIVLYIPILLIMNKCLGYTGIMYSQVISEFICSLFALPCVIKIINKQIKE